MTAPQRDMANAGLYREEAARLRRRAQDAEDDQIRHNLIKIAEQYEQLADTLERRP